MFIWISILKTLLQVSTAVIWNSVDVTSLVRPAQFVGLGDETAFPVVDGVVGLAPVVSRPVEAAGAACALPVVTGEAFEVVSGLLGA